MVAEGGFHGRTMGALALTSKEAYRAPFEPLPGDVTFVPYGDADALAAAVTDRTAAVLLEPIQGEAGVVVPPEDYLAAARTIADEHGALLWLDEVQTGMGRTGQWFAHQSRAGSKPDVVTVAKGLGGGIPIGACIAPRRGRRRCSSPATTAPPSAATRSPAPPRSPSSAPSRTTSCSSTSRSLGQKLRDGLAADPRVTEVRGEGLLIGLDLAADASADVVAAAQQAGFIVNNPTPRRIRLAPPLVLTDDDANALARRLAGASSTRRGLR